MKIKCVTLIINKLKCLIYNFILKIKPKYIYFHSFHKKKD